MMDMVSLTRVGIVAATAGAMRRNTVEALDHTAQRSTFGGVLQTHPLMRDSLAELVVDSTAALSATVAVSELLDSADGGDAEAGGALRLLTPLFKGYFTERARISAGDAMEIRGGNGFIEDWPDARMLRDVSVHAIWEGSGNVIALDVLRALRRGAGPHFLGDLERRAEAAGAGGPAAAAGHAAARRDRASSRTPSTGSASADPDRAAAAHPAAGAAHGHPRCGHAPRRAGQPLRRRHRQRPSRLDRRALHRPPRRRAARPTASPPTQRGSPTQTPSSTAARSRWRWAPRSRRGRGRSRPRGWTKRAL